MNELFSGLNVVSLILILASAVGAFFAGRRGFTKEVSNATTSLNATLKEETESLRRRIEDLEKDRDRQDRILTIIRYALESYKLRVVINHEFVTIVDARGGRKTASIQDINHIRQARKTGYMGDEDAS